MKLGMSGNRSGLTSEAENILIEFLKQNNNIREVHHGDCIGADKDFHDICNENNLNIIIHPPTDNKLRAFCQGNTLLPPKKYLIRNKDIVNSSDFCIFFPPGPEILKSGTWSTIRYAKKINKKYMLVYPDGNIYKS